LGEDPHLLIRLHESCKFVTVHDVKAVSLLQYMMCLAYQAEITGVSA
jgi:hypothetical protein